MLIGRKARKLLREADVRAILYLRSKRLYGSAMGCSIAEFQGLEVIDTVRECDLIRLAANAPPIIPFANYVLCTISTATLAEGGPMFFGNDLAKVELLKRAGWSELAKTPAAHQEGANVYLMGAPVMELEEFLERNR